MSPSLAHARAPSAAGATPEASAVTSSNFGGRAGEAPLADFCRRRKSVGSLGEPGGTPTHRPKIKSLAANLLPLVHQITRASATHTGGRHGTERAVFDQRGPGSAHKHGAEPLARTVG